MKKIVRMHKLVGDFAENKDIAKTLRLKEIIPTLLKGEDVVLDFAGVSGATQSFMHALISDPIRKFRNTAFDKMAYKNVNENIKEIISIVYRYMQESLEDNK